jgi:glycosyltransferase 2 family protein
VRLWLRRLGTGLAVAGSTAFVAYVLSTLELGDLAPHLTPRGIAALAGSIVLYSLIVPLAALAWQVLLAELGYEARWSRLNTILLATQAGKYLPGNVAQHLGRVTLSLALGIPGAVLIASMAYELVLLLLADVLTAVAATALSTPGMELIGGEPGVALAGVVVMSVGALAAISILGKLLPRLIGWFRRGPPRAGDELAPLRPGAIARVIVIYVAAMVCVGASISVLALGLFGAGTADFALLTAAFTIAWAVGFVTPGAPAGIGVREALLLVMLGPPLGAESAALLILALRVATTLGDLLCFAIGMALLARDRRLGRAGPVAQP